MLVLKLTPGKSVTIDGPCRVKVMRLGAGEIRLGFEAAPEVQITREDAADKTPRAHPPRSEKPCPSCYGQGYIPLPDGRESCFDCQGRGRV